MRITVMWPDGWTDVARSWEALEDQIRRDQFRHYGRLQFRREMRDRARIWNGTGRQVRVLGSSRRFLESLSRAGFFVLVVDSVA